MSKKLSKFNQTFCEVVEFDDGALVLSRELYPTEAEALGKFARHLREMTLAEVQPDKLRAELMRYQFAPEWSEHEHAGWYTAFNEGRGAKPVWIYG